MPYTFGPVPSRRLGRSLGIDPVPLKTCNWNCIYCQLGRSRPMTNERREWVPVDDVLADVQRALEGRRPDEIDWVTFAGSGEPTLHSGLGDLIRGVRAMTERPVAVITNGTLLHLREVRNDLAGADAVMPTMMAGSDELFRRIHRPHPDAGFDLHLEGLEAFREEYDGQLWVEVMLLDDINDDERALRDLATVLRRVRPDRVDLVLPNRPSVETWARPADEEGLMRARALLGGVSHVAHPAEGTFDLSFCESATDAIVAIVTRHPMRQRELERALAQYAPGQVAEALGELERGGRVQVVERCGVRFWSAAPSFYPDEASSLRARPRSGETSSPKQGSR
jgi:wyosine [tRNA(Phe)-imidazoG37] synthetase (radical SAM superfamily)